MRKKIFTKKQINNIFSKLNILGIDHLSSSSLSKFYSNRLLFSLDKILKQKSNYPKIKMIRGKTIEFHIAAALENKDFDYEYYYFFNVVHEILQMFKNEKTKNKVKDSFMNDIKQGKEIFISNLRNNILTLIEDEKDLPNWLDTEEIEKIISQIQNEFTTIELVKNDSIDYFRKLKNEEGFIQYQVSKKINHKFFYDFLDFYIFLDWESKNYIFELKTTSKKISSFEEIPIQNKIQIVLYSYFNSKDTRAIYISPPSIKEVNEYRKKKIIIDLLNEGNSIEDIIKFELYKKRSGSETNTTKQYIQKIIDEDKNNLLSEPKSSINEILFTYNDSLKWEKFIKYLIDSFFKFIDSIDTSTNQTIVESILMQSMSNIDLRFVDKDEFEKLKEIFGLGFIYKNEEMEE
jgi:hypothetical protein